MTCRIVPEYSELLEKDLTIFEHLIHRIQSFDNQDELPSVSLGIERESFRTCLKKMLEQSGQLSMIFIKSLEH